MTDAQQIGARIRQAREKHGLTLQGLAMLTGGKLSASRIGNYEQGTRLLKPREARTLAPILKTTPAWLLCVDDDSVLPEEERELLQMYRSTDTRGRENIRSIAKLQPDVGNSPDLAA